MPRTNPPRENSGLMTPNAVCSLVGLSYVSMQRFRSDGTGPAFIRTGDGRIYYRQQAVVDWMAEENRF